MGQPIVERRCKIVYFLSGVGNNLIDVEDLLCKPVFSGEEWTNSVIKGDGLHWNYLTMVDGGQWY